MEEDVVYRVPATAGSTFDVPLDGGYLTVSDVLSVSDFRDFDFATGTLGIDHLDFDGGTMLFGVALLSTFTPASEDPVNYNSLNFMLN
jgi:hypothetical protein